jgi:hypothetical protein
LTPVFIYFISPVGKRGYSPLIPANADLKFTTELMEIKD